VRNFFPKELRLRSNPEFQRVLTRGKKLVGKLILVDYAPRKIPQTRLGVTVSRKYGKSHLRNRFKRMVRESFRLSYPGLPKGYDFNVRPRTAAQQATSQQIQEELTLLLKNL
jgi:ribonuclease P protein component